MIMSGIVAAVFAAALTAGAVPAEPWTSADEQLNLYEIWNELHDTDYESNLDLEEYRVHDARMFVVGRQGGTVEAVARFHHSKQEFGYYTRKNGTNDKEILFEVTDWGMLERGEYRERLVAEPSFGFYAAPLETAYTWFSEPAHHPEPYTGQDQLAVYEAPDGKLLLAWEADPVEESNRDFNDLVVELDLGGGFLMLGAGGAGGFWAPLGGLAGLAGLAAPGWGGSGGSTLLTPPMSAMPPAASVISEAAKESPLPPAPPMNPVNVVPEPQTIIILVLGLAALAFHGSRRWKQRRA